MVIRSEAVLKMRHKAVITKLLQTVTEVYYKVLQVLQNASGIIKCDRLLLQNASGITKCDSYHKIRCSACGGILFMNNCGCFP